MDTFSYYRFLRLNIKNGLSDSLGPDKGISICFYMSYQMFVDLKKKNSNVSRMIGKLLIHSVIQ